MAPSAAAGGPQVRLPSKRVLAIGGAVLLLIIIVAVATRPGTKVAIPVDAAVAKPAIDAGEIVIGSDPADDTLARAKALADAGRTSQAIDLLVKGRAIFPTNAPMAYLAGKLYFGKLYWNDGIVAFRTALRLDPTYRTDPELIKTVLRGFITTPDYNDDLAAFLRNDLGDVAKTYVAEAASTHPNAGIRARAAALLKRF